MRAVTVFIADDHPIVRDGLRALVDAQHDLKVIGEAGDGEEALARIVDLAPDVALVDVSMPRLAGAEVVKSVARACPSVKALALSAHDDPESVREMIAAGAYGYVVKRAAAVELVRAIRAVAAGERYVDPELAAKASRASDDPGAREDGASLSDREEEVLRLAARGFAMKEIASQLDVAVRTVETYKARAMAKASLESRADLVRFACDRGWLGER